MSNRASPILDEFGKPFVHTNGKPRQELLDYFAEANKPTRGVAATYDAARDLTETANHWADADQYDADSANSRAVREKLVPRSRYEIGNNGYADGIASSYANDLVGAGAQEGPQLRMQTGSTGFNQMVELRWFEWCKAIHFRRKLWCLAHAKHSDGEGLAVIRTNPNVANEVKLDVVLYETEQCQTPYMPLEEPGYIDGIKFDEFGNPVYYDILREHPGSISYASFGFEPEQIPAKYVCHWFKLRRPGQHRGIPETSSTLNLGAESRDFRESTRTHARMIAKLTLFLKSLFPPDVQQIVTPMSTVPIQPGTMTAMPNTMEPWQAKVEQPSTTYEMFNRSLISEQARPKSMGYGIAACDSSKHNYASGQLDHLPYHKALDIDRLDGNDLVLDRVFDVWFEEAIRVYGWLGGNPRAVSVAARAHQWDWPKHPTIDIQAKSNSTDKDLKNGTTSLDAEDSENGKDYEDRIAKQAASNGLTVDQQRQVNMLLNLPQHVIPYAAQIIGLKPAGKQNPNPNQQSGSTSGEPANAA